MKFLKENYRWANLLFAIPIGFILTILGVIGFAFGLELRDKQYINTFDWLDVASVTIGGVIGQIIQIIIILLLV